MLEAFWKYSDTLLPLLALLVLLPSKSIEGKGLLVAYFALTILILGYSNWLADRQLYNTHVYHAHSLMEAFLLVPLLNQYAKPNKWLLAFVLVLYTALWSINILLWEPLSEFNSNSATLLSFIISFLR